MLTTDTSLLRLLQLSSVSLPVGGYAFSQGLEFAIDSGFIKTEAHVQDWVDAQLAQSLCHLDLPILRHSLNAINHQDWSLFSQLNDLSLACRESKELRLTETAMGEALARLLSSLEIENPLPRHDESSFVCLFALASAHWQIAYQLAATGFTWSWLENQIAAATKLVPLGQTQAQRLLGQLQGSIPDVVSQAMHIEIDEIGAGLPMAAIMSARHEQQYSRLFRS